MPNLSIDNTFSEQELVITDRSYDDLRPLLRLADDFGATAVLQRCIGEDGEPTDDREVRISLWTIDEPDDLVRLVVAAFMLSDQGGDGRAREVVESGFGAAGDAYRP